MITISLQHAFFLFFILCFRLSPSAPEEVEQQQLPQFVFSWLDDRNTFEAGESATIKIRVLGQLNFSLPFNPSITVDRKPGNSSLVSGVITETPNDTDNWRITFIPIRTGLFNVLIDQDSLHVFDSSLHYNVNPGKIYPSACVATWTNHLTTFKAGATASVSIIPKDAFGNAVNATGEDLSQCRFSLSASHMNGSLARELSSTGAAFNEMGSIVIEFICSESGKFLLRVFSGDEDLRGSPLQYSVRPGDVDVANSIARLNSDVYTWQIFSTMEVFIHQRDQFGNPVPGLKEFDIDVVGKESNLTLPIADLRFLEASPGVNRASFTLLERGTFSLLVYDSIHNQTLGNTPLEYSVFAAYCDGQASVVNGSGLSDSTAGQASNFSVFLNDEFMYPSFVEAADIRVLTSGESGDPSVQSRTNETLSNAFDVIYTLNKSGTYSIDVFAGNVALNSGRPFMKQVRPGDVDVSLSIVSAFPAKIAEETENKIVVALVDSFSNPVFSQETKLKLEVTSGNASVVSGGSFEPENTAYKCRFLVKEVGRFEMCVLFDGKRLSSCPFIINVYSEDYFPRAVEDVISVWQDESVAFDVLANDYYTSGNETPFDFTKPKRGSLLQHGRLLRYTPYSDYVGNDSFTYTINDANGNLASAPVNITIHKTPPFLASVPLFLQATEDLVSPRYGGFTGMKMKYSNLSERISVSFRVDFGSVFLAPMVMTWHPSWEGLDVRYENNDTVLTLWGTLDVLNEAMQSLQYLGGKDFYGEDKIRVSCGNENGNNEMSVGVLVDAINDPPFIISPEFILLKTELNECLVYDKAVDQFEFYVGDPDQNNYSRLGEEFVVTCSMEVNDGVLSTRLHSDVFNTTEVKLQKRNQWQPTNEYVSIGKYFRVKAKGIRFQGTIDECNSAMQNLTYHPGKIPKGALLTVRVNDLGRYGCYSPYCDEKITVPLTAEAKVSLLYKKPLSSFAAKALGSAIIVESILLGVLGFVLVFFTCKSAIILKRERTSM